MGGVGITPKGASAIFNALLSCETIHSLDISRNELNDECMVDLAKFLQENQSIEVLRLSSTNITDVGFTTILSSLIGNSNVKEFYAYSPKITTETVPLVKEVIMASNISKLDLYHYESPTKEEITKLLSTPLDLRLLPIKSTTKSAAKG